MMSDGAVRFWQPAGESPADFLCAYLETGWAAAHVHEEWQFAVAEAPAGVSVGAFRRYAAHASDVTVIAPHEVHTERGGRGPAPRWRVLHVAASVVGRLYQGPSGGSGRPAPRFRGPVLADPPAAAELRALLRDSEHGATGDAFVPRTLRWLQRLLDRHATELTVPSRPLAVERVRVYLAERPTQAVSLPEVVAVAGVTTSHLVRSFSRVVGLPPKSYHAQIRLARARRLLAEGRSATWVAYECGFADQSHLSRRFRDCFGLTPSAFQAQYRAGRLATPRDDLLPDVDSNAA
jgi:AraC-like DNA-binding protein